MSIRCLGEAHLSDSRKASLQSRHSSTRGSRRARGSSSEVGSVSVRGSQDRYSTANVINAHDKALGYQHMMGLDRAPTPPPGRWLAFEFEVQDTGPGIPEDLHDKIFEPVSICVGYVQVRLADRIAVRTRRSWTQQKVRRHGLGSEHLLPAGRTDERHHIATK